MDITMILGIATTITIVMVVTVIIEIASGSHHEDGVVYRTTLVALAHNPALIAVKAGGIDSHAHGTVVLECLHNGLSREVRVLDPTPRVKVCLCPGGSVGQTGDRSVSNVGASSSVFHENANRNIKWQSQVAVRK